MFEDDKDYLYFIDSPKNLKADEYFIPLVSYIHQNPVKAGIVKKLEEYSFSSFIDYVCGRGLTDTDFSLNLLGENEWLRLHQVIQSDNIDTVDKMRLSEEKIRRRILQYTGGKDLHEVMSWTKQERNGLLKQLKEREGLSIRQIERATGISRGVVAKC